MKKRLATFEEGNSAIEKPVSEEMRVASLKCCKEIERQVNRFSGGGRLREAELYFKVDPLNRVYLVQVGALKVSKQFSSKREMVLMPTDFKVPTLAISIEEQEKSSERGNQTP